MMHALSSTQKSSFHYLDDNLGLDPFTGKPIILEKSQEYSAFELARIFTEKTGTPYTSQDIIQKFGTTTISDYDLFLHIDKHTGSDGVITAENITNFMKNSFIHTEREQDLKKKQEEIYSAQDIVDMIYLYTGEKVNPYELVGILQGKENLTTADINQVNFNHLEFNKIKEITDEKFEISLHDIEMALTESGLLEDYLQKNIWQSA